jgi:hypothetical protein
VQPWVTFSDDDPAESLSSPSRWGLEDLILLQDHLVAIGVPYSADDELKRNVFAGLKAYVAGNRSIDYTLQSYGHLWGFQPLETELASLYDATSNLRPLVVNALEKLRYDDPAEVPLAVVAAEMALIRLQNTFQTAVLLVRQRFHYETATLERLIIEQLAWAYTIHDCDDDHYFEVSPTSCVTALKELFPWLGRLYGELSVSTHMKPSTTTRYLRDEGNGLVLHHRQSDWADVDAVFLLYLADALTVVSERVSRDSSIRPEAITFDSSTENGTS